MTNPPKEKPKNNSGPSKSKPKASPPPKQEVSCWAASLVSPFANGPCSIPDEHTSASCLYSSRATVEMNLSSVGTVSNSYNGVMTFHPHPLRFVESYLWDNTTPPGVVSTSITQGTVPNLTAIMPNRNTSTLRVVKDRVRPTSLGVNVSLEVQDRLLSGIIYTGFMRCRTDGSTVDAVDIAGISAGDLRARCIQLEKHVVGPRTKEFSVLWRPAATPQYVDAYDGITYGSIYDREFDQYVLVLFFEGFQTDGSPGTTGPGISANSVTNWEIIPAIANAMATMPTPSKYDPQAHSEALNVTAQCPTLQETPMRQQRAGRTESPWVDWSAVRDTISPYVRPAVQYGIRALIGRYAPRRGASQRTLRDL